MVTPATAKTKIAYCPDCGEYLGDFVNGILYKFGKGITEFHQCENQRIAENMRDYWKHQQCGADL